MCSPRTIGAIIVAFIAFAVLAFLWHNIIFVNQYSMGNSVGSMANPILINVAALLGVIFMTYFLWRAGKQHTWKEGAQFGGIFLGGVMLVFGVLNMAIVPFWQWSVVGLDVIWAIVTGAVSGAILAAIAFRPTAVKKR